MMEPFYRGKDGRIGLGLPLAKGIIEAHHGQLTVQATVGGAFIALPLDHIIERTTEDSGHDKIEVVGHG